MTPPRTPRMPRAPRLSRRPRLAALLCAPLLALGLASCGTSTASTSSFHGEAQQVAKAVSDLQSNASSLNAGKICGENLTASDVADLNRSTGGCKHALESQLKQIDNFEATVESVHISGRTATARVKATRGGKKTIETLALVKEGGKWRVSGLG